MSHKSKAPLGAGLIVLSSFFYASYGVWTKLMGEFFGGYTASALRSVLVLVLLVPAAVFYQKIQPIRWKQNWKYLVGMTFASLFIWGPLYFAVLNAGIGVSLTINYACIVIGMFFFGWLLVGEKLTKDKLVSATLGFLGLGLVFSPSIGHIGLLALSAAAISGIAVAANMVITKKLPYNATQATVALWVTSVIANVPMAFVLRESQPLVGLHHEWLYLVIFAVASVLASWTFVKGVKLIEAGAAGILGLLEIVFGILFGVLLFHERPGLIVLSGAFIIIFAAAIPYVKNFNLKRGTLDPA